VWADKLVADGVGNFARDPGEDDTTSDSSGSYGMDVDYSDYVIVTAGGEVEQSDGSTTAAAPMMAPPPESGQSTTNITPLTTLVATEPELKAKLDAIGGWNADIASPSGVNAGLLRVAKTVETLWSTLGTGNNPLAASTSQQLRALSTFAEALNRQSASLASEDALQAAASSALDTILSDTTLVRALSDTDKAAIKDAMSAAVVSIAAVLPESGTVIETEVLSSLEVAQTAALETLDSVLGNQVTISLGGVNFDPIIISISIEIAGTTVTLSADVDDDTNSSLSYQWTTSSGFTISANTSTTATISDYDGTGLNIRLRVTDPGQLSDSQACSVSGVESNTCTFVGN
jgi:hypothetical protein